MNCPNCDKWIRPIHNDDRGFHCPVCQYIVSGEYAELE